RRLVAASRWRRSPYHPVETPTLRRSCHRQTRNASRSAVAAVPASTRWLVITRGRQTSKIAVTLRCPLVEGGSGPYMSLSPILSIAITYVSCRFINLVPMRPHSAANSPPNSFGPSDLRGIPLTTDAHNRMQDIDLAEIFRSNGDRLMLEWVFS